MLQDNPTTMIETVIAANEALEAVGRSVPQQAAAAKTNTAINSGGSLVGVRQEEAARNERRNSAGLSDPPVENSAAARVTLHPNVLH